MKMIFFFHSRFESQLELPQFPEMIFADNILRLQHEAGYGMEFNALDALKLVDAHHDPLKVAVSDAWREARFRNFPLILSQTSLGFYMAVVQAF